MTIKVDFNKLSFEGATPVVCVVKKFAFPVGTFEAEGGGDDLVNPDTGEKIVDQYNSKVAEFGKGIVYKNRNESISAAMSDGESIFIINDVSDEDAETLFAKVNELGGDPRQFTKAQTREVLSLAGSLGYDDIYASDLKYSASKLASTNEISTEVPGLSYGRRNDRLEGKKLVAVFVEGQNLVFVGQAKSAGNEQAHAGGFLATYDEGAPANDQVRSIDAEKLRTYVIADEEGSTIVPNKNIKTVQAATLAL